MGTYWYGIRGEEIGWWRYMVFSWKLTSCFSFYFSHFLSVIVAIPGLLRKELANKYCRPQIRVASTRIYMLTKTEEVRMRTLRRLSWGLFFVLLIVNEYIVIFVCCLSAHLMVLNNQLVFRYLTFKIYTLRQTNISNSAFECVMPWWFLIYRQQMIYYSVQKIRQINLISYSAS